VLAQFAFWLLAATDRHAKNFSIQHRRGVSFDMTPLYDVALHGRSSETVRNTIPYQRAKLAMGVKAGNMHYRLRDIRARHWCRPAGTARWRRAWIQRSPLEAELPDHFPRKVWVAVAGGCSGIERLFVNPYWRSAERAGES
jgi:serine/threonine-protein kinase HipA